MATSTEEEEQQRVKFEKARRLPLTRSSIGAR